jgi:glucose-6-phosphate 1-dehydrogenase
MVFKQPPLHAVQGGDDGKERKASAERDLHAHSAGRGHFAAFGAKVPGPNDEHEPVDMNFSYADAFGKSSANGYERLLLDAMLGDGTLFAHRDGVEATWALMTPILEAWAKSAKDFPNYEAGSWGPPAADAC